jgi:hypothetical protein
VVAPAGEGRSALGRLLLGINRISGTSHTKTGAPDDIVHNKDEKFDHLVVDIT